MTISAECQSPHCWMQTVAERLIFSTTVYLEIYKKTIYRHSGNNQYFY